MISAFDPPIELDEAEHEHRSFNESTLPFNWYGMKEQEHVYRASRSTGSRLLVNKPSGDHSEGVATEVYSHVSDGQEAFREDYSFPYALVMSPASWLNKYDSSRQESEDGKIEPHSSSVSYFGSRLPVTSPCLASLPYL